MKCIAELIWDDSIWYSNVTTADGDNVCLTLESKLFDTLVERIRIALPEMLELNFGYVGDVEVSFHAIRNDSLYVEKPKKS